MFFYFFIIFIDEFDNTQSTKASGALKRKNTAPTQCLTINGKILRLYDYIENFLENTEDTGFDHMIEESTQSENKTSCFVSSTESMENNTLKETKELVRNNEKADSLPGESSNFQNHKFMNSKSKTAVSDDFKHYLFQSFSDVLNFDKVPYISDAEIILFLKKTIEILENDNESEKDNEESKKLKSENRYENIIDLFYIKKEENYSVNEKKNIENEPSDQNKNTYEYPINLEKYKLRKEYHALTLFVPESFGIFFGYFTDSKNEENNDLENQISREIEILNDFNHFKSQYVIFLKSALISLSEYFNKNLKRPIYGIWYMRIICENKVELSNFSSRIRELRNFISKLSVVFLGVRKPVSTSEDHHKVCDIINAINMFDIKNIYYFFLTRYFYNNTLLTDNTIQKLLFENQSKTNISRDYIHKNFRSRFNKVNFEEMNSFIVKLNVEMNQKKEKLNDFTTIQRKKDNIKFSFHSGMLRIKLLDEEKKQTNDFYRVGLHEYITFINECLNYIVVQSFLE